MPPATFKMAFARSDLRRALAMPPGADGARKLFVLLSLIGAANLGCEPLTAQLLQFSENTDAGAAGNLGADAGMDAGSDSGGVPTADAGPDAGIDAGPDAGVDAGPDSGIAAAAICIIDGQTFPSRALNPADRTQCCNPSASPTAWQQTLVAGNSYPLSGGSDLSTADFDGDGRPDLAICTFGAVEILLGTADGGLGQPISAPLNNIFCGTSVGYLNGDGLPDVVVAAGTVAVFLSTGHGNLASEVDYLPQGQIQRVAVGDFDNDGWPDVAATDCGGAVTILFNLGTGDGTLGRAKTYVSNYGVGVGCQLRVGDFNGDGWLDFATTDLTSTVAIALNQKDGTFGTPVLNTTIPYPWALWTGPLVGGQVDDLAVGTGGVTNTYAVGGDLEGLSSSAGYASGVNAGVMAIADFDGDGHMDILAGGQTSLVVFYNQGMGTFWPAATTTVSFSIQSMVTGDFNGDGATDVAVIGDDSVYLFLNACP